MAKSFFFLLVFPILLSAQRNAEHEAIMAKLYPTEAVETFDLRTSKKIKQVFFNQEWLQGHLLFVDKEARDQDFPFKYDILNQELNVYAGGTVYVVPLNNVHGFLLKGIGNVDHEFRMRKIGKEARATIFEVAVKGKYQLLVKHYAEKMKSNYVPALDAGNMDEKVVVKERFYLIDNRGKMLEIPKKQKVARELMSKYAAARKYLAKNKVNFKNKKSLTGLVLFMNNY